MKRTFPSILILIICILGVLGVVWVSGCKGVEKVEIKKDFKYYFISYNIQNGRSYSIGNFYARYDTLPNVDYIRQYVYDFAVCDGGYSIEQVIITGLYQFKDSIEAARFRHGREEPIVPCDSINHKTIFH